jgi:hypothetical protein
MGKPRKQIAATRLSHHNNRVNQPSRHLMLEILRRGMVKMPFIGTAVDRSPTHTAKMFLTNHLLLNS